MSKDPLSFSANSVGLHIRERVVKIKENGKKTKKKTYKMGRKNMAGKNSRTCTFGTKLQKYYNFFKFLLERYDLIVEQANLRNER